MLALGLLIGLFSQAAFSQAQLAAPLSTATPSDVGVSAERLKHIDRMCHDAIRNGEVPGLVALVARHGQIVYHKAFGMADNASRKALRKTAFFASPRNRKRSRPQV